MKIYTLSIIILLLTAVWLKGKGDLEKLHLNHELTITDDNPEIFKFLWPNSLLVLPRGDLLIGDKDQILHFTSRGKFIKNLLQKGEGPGEIAGPFHFSYSRGEVVAFDFIKNKVVIKGLAGDLQMEWKTNSSYDGLISLSQEEMLVIREDPDFTKKEGDIILLNSELLKVFKNRKKESRIFTFPLRALSSQSGINSIDHLIINIIDSNRAVATWRREYQVGIIDLKTGVVLKTFNRTFEHVKSSKTAGKVEGYCDYLPDIRKLIKFKEEIWVETSASVNEGDHIFDRFSMSGDYLGSFHTGIEGRLLQIYKGDFYYQVFDEDGNLVIKKYVK